MRLIYQYLHYLLHARTHHGIHSPFVYNLITNVLRDKRQFYAFEEIGQVRKDIGKSDELIILSEYGAPSKTMATQRTLASIVRKASLRPKYGKLLFRLANYFQPVNILEIGTGLGISTAYIALAKRNANMITIEGEEELAEEAQLTFDQLDIDHVTIKTGPFSKELPAALEELSSLDFAFIDGNHRYQATLDYFYQCKSIAHNGTILVFDDIRWSSEMMEAWQTIVRDQSVTLSIDLFFVGIVFFNQELSKEHYTLRY